MRIGRFLPFIGPEILLTPPILSARTISSVRDTTLTDGRQIAGVSGNATTDSLYNSSGQLIVYHTVQGMDERKIERFYDGTGREGKRSAMDFVEVQPDQWEWQADGVFYYIRSTVLGGEIVSETGGIGEKRRTYVRAAGTVIAWQNGFGASENVSFQVSDASRMSYRTSDASGNIFDNEYNEGGPAELDPMGGNMGMENPYIVSTSGNSCEGCIDLTPEMPMYVDGIRVSSTIDGMAIPLDLALSHLGNGTAILDARFNSRRLLAQIGIFSQTWEESWTSDGWVTYFNEEGAPTSTVWERDAVVNVQSRTEVSMGRVSWNASQSGLEQERKLNRMELKKIADDIQLILDGNSDCLAIILGVWQNASSDENPLISSNPLDVFWAIAMQNGIFVKGQNRGNGAQAKGSVGDFDASIEFNPRNFIPFLSPDIPVSKGFVDEFRRSQELLRAFDALNEVIHHGGAFTYDDRDVSIALANHLKIEPPNYGWKTLEDVTAWSFWFHTKIDAYCSVSGATELEKSKQKGKRRRK